MLILSEKILALSAAAAKLSHIAYFDPGALPSDYLQDFDAISFHTDEPDQAVVAQKDGHCYLAFRGTSWENGGVGDWLQNINPTSADIYLDNNIESGEFCETRAGFSDFLTTDVVNRVTNDLLKCFESCENDDQCLILTGHSQGGASAAVASIMFHSLKPTVITFGQNQAIDEGCSLMPDDTRYYRFINSVRDGDDYDLNFDPVVFVSAPFSQSVHFGLPILLGEARDGTSVKLLDDDFVPGYLDRIKPAAHDMVSYMDKLMDLLNNNAPIPTDGFPNGAFCVRDYNQLCASSYCGDSSVCDEPIEQLCVKDSCEYDDECAGDYSCVSKACADGRAELDCPCFYDRECRSGDCKGPWFQPRTCYSDGSPTPAPTPAPIPDPTSAPTVSDGIPSSTCLPSDNNAVFAHILFQSNRNSCYYDPSNPCDTGVLSRWCEAAGGDLEFITYTNYCRASPSTNYPFCTGKTCSLSDYDVNSGGCIKTHRSSARMLNEMETSTTDTCIQDSTAFWQESTSYKTFVSDASSCYQSTVGCDYAALRARCTNAGGIFAIVDIHETCDWIPKEYQDRDILTFPFYPTCMHPSCDINALDQFASQGCTLTTTLSDTSRLDLTQSPEAGSKDMLCADAKALAWVDPGYKYVMSFGEECKGGSCEDDIYDNITKECEKSNERTYLLVDEHTTCPWHETVVTKSSLPICVPKNCSLDTYDSVHTNECKSTYVLSASTSKPVKSSKGKSSKLTTKAAKSSKDKKTKTIKLGKRRHL